MATTRGNKTKSPSRKPRSRTPDYERALSESPSRYVLKLYVAGMRPNSSRAITGIKQFCEEHLEGRYELEVIDLYQQPTLAEGEQIVAAPTLIRQLPRPLAKFIGDMSDLNQILVGLDLRTK